MEPSGSDHNIPLVVARKTISRSERRAAAVAIMVLVLGTVTWAPFAEYQLPRIDSFIPTVQTVMCIADLLTAALLLSQYSVQPHTSLLLLASGYIGAGLFAFLQTLAFPGGYAPGGLFGDGLDTPAWLFVLWHTSFSLGVLLYGLSKDRNEPEGRANFLTGRRIFLTTTSVVAAVGALTWSITAGAPYLFPLYSSSITQQTLAANYTNMVLGSFYAVALVVLVLRRRTVLDVWLIVVMCAWVPNFLVAALTTTVRFSLGWYAARVYALVASWTVLVVLLTETTLIYARLANAWAMRRRERAERMMSVEAATGAISHELGGPLGSIAMNAETALIYLESKSLDIHELKSVIKEIVTSSHHAGKVLTSVRAMFKHSTEPRTSVEIDRIGHQVLTFLEPDLQACKITVEAEFDPRLPLVRGNAVQIQQIILNLAKNAIEAMINVNGTRILRLGARAQKEAVIFFVQDSGTGVPYEHQESIFDAFFTTKASGMGLGLAICRTLAERQGGVLRVAKSDSKGSVFELELPSAA